jgi:hypothetical protein
LNYSFPIDCWFFLLNFVMYSFWILLCPILNFVMYCSCFSWSGVVSCCWVIWWFCGIRSHPVTGCLRCCSRWVHSMAVGCSFCAIRHNTWDSNNRYA